ncbi:MAG: tetratricopeptide repeat protein [Ruminococcaceae bacterium]|nr:tetratricopeptide repeat protein [Oscillospiraceae bacterium]
MKRLICLFLSLLIILWVCGKITETSITWQEQYDLGVRYLTEGNYAEAILAFSAAIEIEPNMTAAYLGRADAYIGSGETEANLAAALADYETSLKLDEANAAAWLGLADVYIRQGNFDKALEVLRKGLGASGSNAEIADKIAEIESGNISDSSGKTRRKSTYDGEGTLIWYHTYTYNEQGRSASVTAYDGQGNQTSHVDLQYDAQGNNIVSYYTYTANGRVGRIECDFDDNRKVTERRHFDVDTGELETRFLESYDSEGREIKSEQYNCRGDKEELVYYDIYEYDEHGRQVKTSRYASDGALRSYSTRTYLKNGKTHEYSWYDAYGNLQWKRVSRYDEKGNYIGEERYDAEGKLTQSTVYE